MFFTFFKLYKWYQIVQRFTFTVLCNNKSLVPLFCFLIDCIEVLSPSLTFRTHPFITNKTWSKGYNSGHFVMLQQMIWRFLTQFHATGLLSIPLENIRKRRGTEGKNWHEMGTGLYNIYMAKSSFIFIWNILLKNGDK